MPYGSPGAALFGGIQQALLQRQALARQAMLDELNKKKTEAEIETQKATTQSLSDQRAAAANAALLKQLEATHAVGAELSPEDEAALRKLPGGAALILGQKPMAPIPEPTSEAAVTPPAALASTEEAAAPPKPNASITPGEVPPALEKPGGPTFAGTVSQQEKEQQRKYAEQIVADPNTPQAVKLFFQSVLTGKTIPAGIAVPKTPSETAVEHQAEIEDLLAKKSAHERDPKTNPPLTGAEQDKISGYMARQTQPRTEIYNQTTGPQQEDTKTNRAITHNHDSIDKVSAPILQQMERGARLLDNLGDPNIVTDAIVAPEFLTVMAGGFGTGLRMSEAELRRINMAQSEWNNLRARLNKWAVDGKNVQIQDPTRKAMIRAASVMMARANNRLSLYNDYWKRINEAGSPKEANDLLAEMHAKETKLAGSPDVEGGGGPAPARKRIVYDANGNPVTEK